MRLYLVLLLRLRGKGAEGDDGEDDCQHNEQDRDHCLDVVPDVSAGGKFSGDGLEQGSDRDYQHEAHGDEEHLVVSADIAEPCADSDQAESGEELVGCTEEGPYFGISGHAERDAQDNGDCCREVRIYEDLPAVFDIFRGLAVDKPEFLEHVAGQTGRGVEGGQAKYRDRQDEHLVHDVLDAFICEGTDHPGDTGREDCCGGCESGGQFAGLSGHLADRVCPDISDRAQGQDCDYALDEHCSVADGLRVALIVDLLGGCSGGNQ